MVRKILRYCIDTIIGIVVLLGLSITVLYFVVGWKPYIVESASIEPGNSEQLKFSVEVPKDLDNDYALSNEKVRWMFSAEEMSSKIPNGNGPKTGVEDMSSLYLAGMVSSLFVMLYMVYRKETE